VPEDHERVVVVEAGVGDCVAADRDVSSHSPPDDVEPQTGQCGWQHRVEAEEMLMVAHPAEACRQRGPRCRHRCDVEALCGVAMQIAKI
jgi:hypothetical protein